MAGQLGTRLGNGSESNSRNWWRQVALMVYTYTGDVRVDASLRANLDLTSFAQYPFNEEDKGNKMIARHTWKKWTIATAAVIGMVGGVTACSSGDGGTGDGGGDGPIVIGSIFDVTGVQNIQGQAMLDALNLAIDEVNNNGGLLGRQVELKFYDSQSDQSKYAQYANQLALQDKPDVVIAGISSASREAIRPIFSQNKTLYFYPELYEGGVCDINTFAAGVVPSQTSAALVPWAMENYGKRVYIVGADYNFGQISALWGKKYAEDAGAEVVGQAFVPVESSSFETVIDELQTLKPDLVLSYLVGTNHIAFYRGFAAAGLNDKMHIASTTFGLSGETDILSPEEARNISAAYNYFETMDTPENQEFLAKWVAKYGEDHAAIPATAALVWNSVMLWAAGVEKAGTTEREAVIEALQSGVTATGPAGDVKLDPGSHHVIQNISIGLTTAEGGFEVVATENAVEPAFEMEVCDLVNNPDINEQFTP